MLEAQLDTLHQLNFFNNVRIYTEIYLLTEKIIYRVFWVIKEVLIVLEHVQRACTYLKTLSIYSRDPQ